MDNLKSLFDAFYNRLILRDFFGKIIPGLILISGFTLCIGLQFDKLSLLAETIKGISWAGGLVIFGLAWLMGFAVQSFGESTPSTPKSRVKTLITLYNTEQFDNNAASYDLLIRFFRKASENESITWERLAVIKEACGNGYVSLILSLCLIAFYAVVGLILRLFEIEQSANFTLLTSGNLSLILTGLAFWIFIIYYLKKMHFIHVERQYEYMKKVLGE